jgi:hypothetical protein
MAIRDTHYTLTHLSENSLAENTGTLLLDAVGFVPAIGKAKKAGRLFSLMEEAPSAKALSANPKKSIDVNSASLDSAPSGASFSDVRYNTGKPPGSSSGFTGEFRSRSHSMEQRLGSSQGAGKTPSGRVVVPGDADFVGPMQSRGWRLIEHGDGAHLVEKANVRGRSALSVFDQPNTPTFYPQGATKFHVGESHRRLHAATRAEGIKLRGGNPNMNDQQLLDAYRRAYSRPEIQGIRGDVRTSRGTPIPGGANVTPSQAYEALLRFYNK